MIGAKTISIGDTCFCEILGIEKLRDFGTAYVIECDGVRVFIPCAVDLDDMRTYKMMGVCVRVRIMAIDETQSIAVGLLAGMDEEARYE